MNEMFKMFKPPQKGSYACCYITIAYAKEVPGIRTDQIYSGNTCFGHEPDFFYNRKLVDTEYFMETIFNGVWFCVKVI